jgi:AraC family transcriptional regulator of adaptative response / DNA-3-methyladenine glycosylase II
METPHEGLSRLSPTPQRIARASLSELASLGITQARARSIIAIAQDVAADRLHLDAGADPERTIAQLVELPGIGAWTAHYIAMRALRWPDAFPKEDIALRNSLGGLTPAQAEKLSRGWKPWRSYATLYLWSRSARISSPSATVASTRASKSSSRVR